MNQRDFPNLPDAVLRSGELLPGLNPNDPYQGAVYRSEYVIPPLGTFLVLCAFVTGVKPPGRPVVLIPGVDVGADRVPVTISFMVN